MNVSPQLGFFAAVDWGSLLSQGVSAASQIAQTRQKIKLQKAQNDALLAAQREEANRLVAEQRAVQQALQAGKFAPSIAVQATPSITGVSYHAQGRGAPAWLLPVALASVSAAGLLYLINARKK